MAGNELADTELVLMLKIREFSVNEIVADFLCCSLCRFGWHSWGLCFLCLTAAHFYNCWFYAKKKLVSNLPFWKNFYVFSYHTTYIQLFADRKIKDYKIIPVLMATSGRRTGPTILLSGY